MSLLQQLGAKLRTTIADNGPEGSVSVCKDVAPLLAGQLSRETGWRVARVSLRTRNPLLGTPDAWEQKVLEEFERRRSGRARNPKRSNSARSSKSRPPATIAT